MNIIIIGGGLAGLTTAILLQKNGHSATVIEKNSYPFDRVCGEYVSNETLPFLKSLGLDIAKLCPSRLNRLTVSTISGKQLSIRLPLGGFGLSRYRFDDLLYRHAIDLGVNFAFKKVDHLSFRNDLFQVHTSDSSVYEAPIAVAAYGKRSNLDKLLSRDFFSKRSPYLGVKYHIHTELPPDLIRIDYFDGGYCGVCKIEDDKYNLCYLSETKNLKRYSGIQEMEEMVLHKNPNLRDIFLNSEFLFKKPLVINEISFERKTLVENHLLFCGDAAGMISPLCGNGMAMAIHSGKILAETILKHSKYPEAINRTVLEREYVSQWNKEFALRLKTGRLLQKLLAKGLLSESIISLLRAAPSIAQLLVRKTHGKVIM